MPSLRSRRHEHYKLMKQAQKMQEQMAKTQAELEEKTVESAGRGGGWCNGGRLMARAM